MKLADIHVGDVIRYHPVIGEPDNGRDYTVRATGTMPSGHDVAWLDGKAGCVAVEALTRPRGAAGQQEGRQA
jgi:hypothetical protein